MSTFIELHAIQTVPPSNLNRDDNGSPKSSMYGEDRRARVSSQSWKHAMRKQFPEDMRGIRTKAVVKLVAERMLELNPATTKDAAREFALGLLERANIVSKQTGASRTAALASGEVSAIQFLTKAQINAVAELAHKFSTAEVTEDDEAEKNETAAKKAKERKAQDKERGEQAEAVKEAVNGNLTADVVFFGRMFATDKALSTAAVAQVSHPISVHRVENEFDFFTAVTDERGEDKDGGHADMLGVIEFNSSTLYRNANLNVSALTDALGSDADIAGSVTAFISTFVTSMPAGKQNSFANGTLPDAVLIVVRNTQPVNLSGAFEDALRPVEGRSRAAVIAERLASEFVGTEQFLPKHEGAWVIRSKQAYAPLDAAAETNPMKLPDAAAGAVARAIELVRAETSAK